jgi:hypothetical protein
MNSAWRLHAVRPGNAPDIRPELPLNFVNYRLTTLVGREDTMHQAGIVGVGT